MPNPKHRLCFSSLREAMTYDERRPRHRTNVITVTLDFEIVGEITPEVMQNTENWARQTVLQATKYNRALGPDTRVVSVKRRVT